MNPLKHNGGIADCGSYDGILFFPEETDEDFQLFALDADNSFQASLVVGGLRDEEKIRSHLWFPWRSENSEFLFHPFVNFVPLRHCFPEES